MAKGSVFTADASAIMPMHPFIATSPLIERGVTAGVNLRIGRREVFDPLMFKGRGITKAQTLVFSGLKGIGKTTGMKFFALICAALQAIDADGNIDDVRIQIDNRKPEEGVAEWASIVEALACEVYRLKDMNLEILSGETLRTEAERLLAAVNVCEFVKGAPLDVDETLALRIAVQYISHNVPEPLIGTRSFEQATRKLNDADIRAFESGFDDKLEVALRKMLVTDDVTYSEMWRLIERPSNIRVEDIKNAGGRVAKYLMLILDGVYGNMFSGGQSLRNYLTNPATLFDMSGVDSDTVSFFEMVRHDALTAALTNYDLKAIPHLRVLEEVQEQAESLPALRARAYYSAKARAFHTVEFSSTQYLSNLQIGEPGSKEHHYSSQIYGGTDVHVLFQQRNEPIDRHMMAELGLSSQDIAFATSANMKLGCCIIKVRNQTPVHMQIIPPPIALKLAKSTGATERMLGRKPILSDPRVQQLLEQRRGAQANT